MKLFLDLENTLIDEWGSNKLLLNKITIIKQFIKKHSIKEATIFSFALTNEKDFIYFKENLQNILEKELNIKLKVVLIENIFNELMKIFGIKAKFYELRDIYLFNQKSDMFTHLIKHLKNIHNETFVLFDDKVDNTSVLLNDTHTKIIFKEI